MKAVHGVNEVPNPSVTATASPTPVPIVVGPPPSETVLLTAPAIKGGDVAKQIQFTGTIIYTAPEQVTFVLYKDGVAMGNYVHDAGGAFTQTITMHWFDAASGKGEPVYELRAYGAVGGITTAGFRRLTVSNL